MTTRAVRTASHLGVLARVVLATSGDVLECGTGLYSTPLLHWLCAPDRPLLSLEADRTWYARSAQQWASDWHTVQLVDQWDRALIDRPWGVVFIDHDAPRRHMELQRLKKHALVVVLHDTSPKEDRRYYQCAPIMRTFRHVVTVPWANTSVLSETVNVAELLR